MDGFLVAMDIEKAFDSLNHDFLILTLEKYDFGKNFTLWAKILLRDQESCVINRGTTKKILFTWERSSSRRPNFSLFHLF